MIIKRVKEVVQEGVKEIVDALKEFEDINEKFADPDADFDCPYARQAVLQENWIIWMHGIR
jgi:FPC/CPF motif-containing protein YcgG